MDFGNTKLEYYSIVLELIKNWPFGILVILHKLRTVIEKVNFIVMQR